MTVPSGIMIPSVGVRERQKVDTISDMSAKGERGVPPVAIPLRGPSPVSVAIAECLRAQSQLPRRGAWSRLIARSPLDRETRRLFRGALVEIELEAALEQRSDAWTVFGRAPSSVHGRSTGRLAIGPSGVVAITSPNHSGEIVVCSGRRMSVDGIRFTTVHDASQDASALAVAFEAVLGHPVRVVAMIAVIDPEALSVEHLPDDVVVVDSRHLGAALEADVRPVLSERDVETLTRAAGGLTQWVTPVVPLREVTDDFRDFAALRTSVDHARSASRAWMFGAAAVATAALIAVGTTLF